MATTAPTVRSLDQILAELGTVYNPQIQNIRTRQAQLPGQIQAEEKGLAAKQESAFGDILSGARRRGTGVAFGGIPLGEQARYSATEYMPALARLKQSGREQAMSLEDAINQIRTEQRSAAMAQQQYEQQRRDAYDTEQRSLAATAAANQAADLSKYFNQPTNQTSSTIGKMTYSFGQPTGANAAVGQGVTQKTGMPSFTFYDNKNKPITAGQYAQLNNMDIRDVLADMYDKGDTSVKNLYNTLYMAGNDQNKLNSIIKANQKNYAHILGGMK